jgi:hypothetical protein
MKLFGPRSLVLAEQVLSSAFNFALVIALSHQSALDVANFGLIYSFALVFAALLKNGALNLFLTSGRSSARTMHGLVTQVLLNPFNFCLLAAFIVFTEWRAGWLFVFVYCFYCFIDIYRTYLIASEKYAENLGFTVGVVSTFFVLFLLRLEALYAFLIATCVLMARYYWLVSRDQQHAELHAPSKMNRDSAVMTLAYTSYAHGPLWLLYAIDATYAAIFVQVRNIFQPAQVLSRVLDIFEKKTSAYAESYYQNFRRVFVQSTVFLSLVTGLLALFGYLCFDLMYQNHPDSLALLLFAYSLVCIGTFVSRPIETFFYGIKRLDVLAKSRIVGTAVFLLLACFVIFFPVGDPLLVVLIGLSIVWLSINLFNLFQIGLNRDDVC